MGPFVFTKEGLVRHRRRFFSPDSLSLSSSNSSSPYREFGSCHSFISPPPPPSNMRVLPLFALAAPLVSAIQFLEPIANSTLKRGNTYSVKWSSVDTDPAH